MDLSLMSKTTATTLAVLLFLLAVLLSVLVSHNSAHPHRRERPPPTMQSCQWTVKSGAAHSSTTPLRQIAGNPERPGTLQRSAGRTVSRPAW